jgi:hypothetical protein
VGTPYSFPDAEIPEFMPLRLALIEDHQALREGLTELLLRRCQVLQGYTSPPAARS